MKRFLMVLVIIIGLILTACQGPTTPKITDGQKTSNVVPTPSKDKSTVRGKLISSVNGSVYANTEIRLAKVFGEKGNSAFTLDTAHSPGDITNAQGEFVIQNLVYPQYVIIVGSPDGNYYIVHDDKDNAVVYDMKPGTIDDLGELKIDYKP